MTAVPLVKSNVDNFGVRTHLNPKIALSRPCTAPEKHFPAIDERLQQFCLDGMRIHSAPQRICDVTHKIKEGYFEDNEDAFFEETFLNPHYSIRDAVHEKLKSFQWLCGEYGITGPDEKIPRTHLYLTVKKGTETSKVLDDLKAVFECKVTDYFDLRPEPEKSVKFKYLSKPASGGHILAVNRADQPNPFPGLCDIENKEIVKSGTLTMFCFKNGSHYALTCFHVGYAALEQQCDEVISLNDIGKMRESKLIKEQKEYAKDKLKYCYRQREITNQHESTVNLTDLGNFYEGFFDSESDIMSIKVNQDVEIDCTVAEIDSPSWVKIWKELNDRVYDGKKVQDGKAPVRVKKVGYPSKEAQGYIKATNYSYKKGDEIVIKNAITVKSASGPFLQPGDSGALLSFLDSNNKEQAFGYAVGEFTTDDGNESFFICFKLDIALNKLQLNGNRFFKKCCTNQ